MRQALSLGAVVTAVAVAACGGGGSSSGTNSSTSTTPAAANGKTVSVKTIAGVGDVLVDGQGRALYTPVQEANGTVHCRGACTSIWKPLSPGSGKPTAAGNAGRLGVITRPDGTKQVTVAGKPLYTFADDTAGHATGNGVADIFGSQRFNWNAVQPDGTPARAPNGTSTSTGGVPGY